TDQQFTHAVNSALSKTDDFQQVINDLKMAMLSYDTRHFEDTYNRLQSSMSFYDLFLKVMVPFLEHIGSLWQTNSITVAHEHYVSNLLRQKLFYQIENLPKPASGKERYVLFLPINELHELGLLFIHYALMMLGKDSIYLGPNVDMESLEGIQHKGITVYITYMTIGPPDNDLNEYFRGFRKKLMKADDKFMVTGYHLQTMAKQPSVKNITIFKNLKDLLNSFMS
ncbi:MAG: B12-binding domain-containing protein, partial [Saprospiraceae bacterium]|nr:B12-binding domain-containing protein [Saprospiraceae bacterium]